MQKTEDYYFCKECKCPLEECMEFENDHTYQRITKVTHQIIKKLTAAPQKFCVEQKFKKFREGASKKMKVEFDKNVEEAKHTMKEQFKEENKEALKQVEVANQAKTLIQQLTEQKPINPKMVEEFCREMQKKVANFKKYNIKMPPRLKLNMQETIPIKEQQSKNNNLADFFDIN